jgi:hypothetical protein
MANAKKPIAKQLKGLIQICEKYRTEDNAAYLDELKREAQMAYKQVTAAIEDYEYSLDTEYLNDMVA